MDTKPLSYLSLKTAVGPSFIHSKGLFAVAPIKKGEVVCVKGGHIFTRQYLKGIVARLGPAEVQIADDLFIGPLDEDERFQDLQLALAMFGAGEREADEKMLAGECKYALRLLREETHGG